jgi:hypothetical protein
MTQNFLSIELLLKHLEKLSEASVRDGEIEVLKNGASSGIKLNRKVLASLRASKVKLESRRVERVGKLYGIDTVHRWCKIIAEVEPRREWWTLRFGKEFSPLVEGGVVPRAVRVLFSTKTPNNFSRGIGQLREIEDLPADDSESVRQPALG